MPLPGDTLAAPLPGWTTAQERPGIQEGLERVGRTGVAKGRPRHLAMRRRCLMNKLIDFLILEERS